MKTLAKPGKSDVQYFSSVPDGLFEKIVTKYTNGQSIHSGHGGTESVKETSKPQATDKNAPMNHE